MDYLQSFDKNMQRTGYLIDADQVQRKRRLNSDYELSFLVPISSEDYTEKILLKGHVKDERGQYYVINSRKRDRTGKKRMAVINCMHVMFKMADFKFPYASYIEEGFGVSIYTLTTLISAATNGKYTFVIDGTFNTMDVKDFGQGNALEALNAVINLYGAEVDPDNFVIHLKNKIGDQNSPHQYRLKKNIISDSFTDDVRTLTTRMYSQMKDGLTFIDLPASNLTAEEYDLLNAIPGAIVGGLIKVNYLISPYWSIWANDTNTYYDGEYINQNIEDQLELLEATRKVLRESEVPQLDITINAADLHKIDSSEPEPHIGDSVLCIDPGMEMNSIDARIVELTEYPFDRNRHATVNLANFMKRDYADIIADLDQSRRIVDDLISGGRVRTNTFEEFAKQAVIDINNSKTQVKYDSRGIVLQSLINPLHLVVHSSAGTYMTKDGGISDKRTAITADGIAAPYIVGILGEFATVKTDNLVAGSVLIGSALIASLKVEKLDVSTAKITSAMIDSLEAGKISAGTITGVTIDVSTNARIGDTLYLNETSSSSKGIIFSSVSGNESKISALSGDMSFNCDGFTSFTMGSSQGAMFNKKVSSSVGFYVGVTEVSLTTHNHNGLYANVSHSHAISDISSLQSILDGKAINMTFDAGTRNLKLFSSSGAQLAIVNIP